MTVAARQLRRGQPGCQREAGARPSEIARRLARVLLLPVLLVLAWSAASRGVPAYVLPAPLDVWNAFVDFVFGGLTNTSFSGSFVSHLDASIRRVISGFLLGIAVGVPLGLVLGYNRWLAGFVEPTLSVFRAVPGICWLPLALVWFGIGGWSSVFLIFLGSFWPIFVSTASGVRYVDQLLLRAAAMLGVSRVGMLWRVVLPAAFPSILNGLRLGLAYSWIYMVLGEFTGVNLGLGATLLLARDALRTDLIVALMFIIGGLGVLTDFPMQWILRNVFHADVK